VTGYRVVQEALNRSLREHGAGHADVRVRYAPAEVVLEVADDGRSLEAIPALGLRERVALYGGELTVGTGGEGGTLVRARLPREVRA
jgi:signal transduction histidine kinase